MLDKIALTLLIVGGINWGSVGLFQFDLVAFLFGGQSGRPHRLCPCCSGGAVVHLAVVQRYNRSRRSRLQTK